MRGADHCMHMVQLARVYWRGPVAGVGIPSSVKCGAGDNASVQPWQHIHTRVCEAGQRQCGREVRLRLRCRTLRSRNGPVLAASEAWAAPAPGLHGWPPAARRLRQPGQQRALADQHQRTDSRRPCGPGQPHHPVRVQVHLVRAHDGARRGAPLLL